MTEQTQRALERLPRFRENPDDWTKAEGTANHELAARSPQLLAMLDELLLTLELPEHLSAEAEDAWKKAQTLLCETARAMLAEK